MGGERRGIRWRATAGLAALLAATPGGLGCAAIVRGSTGSLEVTSDPPGAQVTVDGSGSWTTPAEIELERGQFHYVHLSLPGFREREVSVVSAVDDAGIAWFAVGALFFNVFELISLTQGSLYGFFPNPVHVALEPEPAAAPAPPPAPWDGTLP